MMLVHWLLLAFFVGLFLGFYVPDGATGRIIPYAWIKRVELVGNYVMALSIAGLGLLALTATDWYAAWFTHGPIAPLPLHEVHLHGRQMAGGLIINAVFMAGPIITGLVLIAFAWWLYRRLIVNR